MSKGKELYRRSVLSVRSLYMRLRERDFAKTLACFGALAAVVLVYVSRSWTGRLWRGSTQLIGEFFLHFSQNHPHLSRVLHVGLNVIPDAEFLVLALAGLVYLMPSLITRIETKRALRIGVTAAFLTFGILTLLVNAINREEEDFKSGRMAETISDQGKKLDAVNTTNAQILQYLVSNRAMSEAERRENIEKVLRNEYITSHESIDPQILAGNQMPPSDWMNRRLAELGEHWKVSEPRPVAPIIQEAPKPEDARLVFTLWSEGASLDHPVLSEGIAPDQDGNYPVSFSFGDLSSSAAEKIDVWVALCDGCEFAKEPDGFEKTPGSSDKVRHATRDLINSGTNVPKLTILVKAPHAPWFEVSFHYSCMNCGKMAPVQVARIYEQDFVPSLNSTAPPQ